MKAPPFDSLKSMTLSMYFDIKFRKGYTMNRNELAKSLFDISHLTGEFLLRSGQTSNEYFDKYRFESDPNLLKSIAKHIAPLIPEGTEALAGLEMGGIPIATAVSFETGLPVCFVRKEAKTYGTCKIAEGIDIKGKKLCLIEDVITTGGAVIDATRELRERGAIVEQVNCVIYRGQGEPEKLNAIEIKMNPLFTMQELKDAK